MIATIVFTAIVCVLLGLVCLAVYGKQKEKNKCKAIAKAKQNVIESLANFKEDCELEDYCRELEVITDLAFSADSYLQTITIDTREAYELQQALKNFKQFTYQL